MLAFLDMQLPDEMGIQLQHFDLIGGEQRLLSECGAKDIASTSVMSSQYKNTIQVCNIFVPINSLYNILSVLCAPGTPNTL